MQSKQLLLFIGVVLLLAGCRKDEFLAPPVDTIKAFEFSFMNPYNGRSKPIYDLNDENFLTYFLATNNTIEIKVIENKSFNITQTKSYSASTLFHNFYWGISISKNLKQTSNDHFILTAISESNLDPINGNSYEYPTLHICEFNSDGSLLNKDSLILPTAFVGVYSKPNVEFYNNFYYVGYLSNKYVGSSVADSIHILKFDANFNLVNQYSRIANSNPNVYDTEIIVNSEGIWFYYFDDYYYTDKIVFFEDDGNSISQIFDKNSSVVEDPYYSFGLNNIIKWDDKVTLMGVSYSPFGYTRAAFKSTDYNLTTLKTNRAEFLIDSTWNQNYTGYSFTNQNDLIIHYEEYLDRSIPGFTKFDLNGNKLLEVHLNLPDFSCYPVHVRDNYDGTFTLMGNKKVDGADVWQAFVVIIDQEGKIIRR